VFYLEWRDLMGRLEAFDREYRAGTMPPEQQQRYRALCDTLRRSAPLLKQFDLPLPPIALDASAASQSAQSTR
jgi:hypothetical protein